MASLRGRILHSTRLRNTINNSSPSSQAMMAADQESRMRQDKIRLLLEKRYGISKSTSTINRLVHRVALVLPRFQYSTRDVLTGTTFICYPYQLFTSNPAKFIALCLDHLRRYGLDTSKITIRTDNCAESVGSVFANRDSLFTLLIEETSGAQHSTIPPFNGCVENFHGRTEDEFYDLEDFPTPSDLVAKAFSHMQYFNLERPNLALRMRPFETVKQQTHVKDPHFVVFPPLALEDLPLLVPRPFSVNDVSDEVSLAQGGKTGREASLALVPLSSAVA